MTTEDETRTEQPSETSPLLGKRAPKPIDPSDGIAPDSAITNGAIAEEEDGGDLERQTSLEGRQKQYEGQPEMRKKMKVIFPALTIGVLLSAADQTIIVSSYGKIGSELKALNNVSWIATAYFLTLTSFQPLYGKMSDIFGRKSCLLFAYAVFGLGCLFCGLAQDMNQLIAARAFAGIGGGGMTTVVSILMSDAVPLRERGKWQGYVNIIYATGAGTGAPLGGILADSIGWRWAFLGQVPLCILAFVVVSLVLKLPKREQTDWKQKLRRIDFLGAAILIGAVFTLLLALDRGSNVSWKAKITIISISLSIPLFILFVLVEMKVAKEPFAPGHIIFNRSLFACYLCNFFSFSGWLAALFYIPLYFQAVDGLTATQAGIRLIPGIIAGVSGSLFGGFYMQRTGKFYYLTVIAYTCLVVGMTFVFLFSGMVVNSTLGIIAGMCICGFSNANASRDDQAVATACSYLFRSLGSVFGVSMSATLANQALRDRLAAVLSSGDAATEIAERVRESLAYINTLEPNVKALVRECYAQSTRAAFSLEIGLVAGAAASAWLIKEKALSK
ncbi:unnamed protein product [Aureobasidium mustum]|uniref:Major facilitator superfamily (MFS) profile domain-containing protein n=1 Tax=Aureobasidium mustum TaxID=2773714 RepID=A0A9N8JS67_9PEZI|nr:unnamed protein product [Aureobasidium mustum]